jgi:CRP/FNR family transcriptional regulator, cyclic AMP receptor protein
MGQTRRCKRGSSESGETVVQQAHSDYEKGSEGAMENARCLNLGGTEPKKNGRHQMKVKHKQSFDSALFLSKIGAGRTIKDYEKNGTIFAQGDAADAVFFIQKGKAKLAVVSPQGKEAVVALLGTGDFFGEGCLAGQLRRMATATAMPECSVMRLEKQQVIRVLHDEQIFSELFLRYLLSRNIKIEEDLVDQLFNSSEKRLARVLLLLANFGKEGKPELVIPKMSQETLAEIIGTTRSRVSFFMNRFRKLGFIEYNGGLHIHSSLLHVVLHD